MALLIVTIALITNDNPVEEDDKGLSGEKNKYQNIEYYDAQIYFITSNGRPSTLVGLESATTNIEERNSLTSFSEGIIIIDDSWGPSNKQKKDLGEIIFNGIPVISLGGSALFTDQAVKIGAVAFSDDSGICGVYYDVDADVKYCYSAESGTAANDLLMAYNWATDMIENGAQTTSYGAPPSGSIIAAKDLKCGDCGWLNIRTYYAKIPSMTPEDIWSAQYYIETIPEPGYYTHQTNVKNQVNKYNVHSKLISHGPNTSSEGGSVMTLNKSNLAKDTMELQHDFVKNKIPSKRPFFTESEMEMMFWFEAAYDDAHLSEDTYMVTFNKPTYGIIDNLFTYSTVLSMILYQS